MKYVIIKFNTREDIKQCWFFNKTRDIIEWLPQKLRDDFGYKIEEYKNWQDALFYNPNDEADIYNQLICQDGIDEKVVKVDDNYFNFHDDESFIDAILEYESCYNFYFVEDLPHQLSDKQLIEALNQYHEDDYWQTEALAKEAERVFFEGDF